MPYALPNFFGMATPASPPSGLATLISCITLAVTVGITVWGRGQMKLFPLIIGTAVGYALCIGAGLAGADPLDRIMAAPVFALPDIRYLGVSFQAALLIPFCVAAIVTFVKSVGEFSICQRINDTEWKRPDMMNVRAGLFADGCANALGGLFRRGMGRPGPHRISGSPLSCLP